MKTHFLTIFLLALLSSCHKQTRISQKELAYGTHGEDLSVFHRVVEKDRGLGFKFPGFLIGIEKSRKSQIGFKKGVQEISWQKISHPKNTKHLKGILNDPKRMFISHMVQYSLTDRSGTLSHIDENIFYNTYEKDFQSQEAYPKSFEALDSLKKRLEQELNQTQNQNEPHTHIFVYAMGWNTDQQESFRNINSLVSQLLTSTPPNVNFKPLVIGISWPSEWSWPLFEGLGKGLSYPVKSDDADEVGVIWGSRLLENILVPLKRKEKIPLVVIGHSFGARLVTRAVMSRHLSSKEPTSISTNDIDLVIGLQGAFSVNRFIPEGGIEGDPYIDFEKYAKKFVFTWSSFDKANPIAAWLTGGQLIGGRYGHKQASKYPEIFDFLKIETQDQNQMIKLNQVKNTKKILMVDASTIVNHQAYTKGGYAHSDIYTPAMAKFLWQCLINFL